MTNKKSNRSCFFCADECELNEDSQSLTKKYTCSKCGKYTLSAPYGVCDYKMSTLVPIMYYYLLHHSNGKTINFVSDASEFIDDGTKRHVDFIMLERMKPQNLNERIDMALLNLSKEIQYLGDSFVLPSDDVKLLSTTENIENWKSINLGDFCDSSINRLTYYNNIFVGRTFSLQSFAQEVSEVIDILTEYEFLKQVRTIEEQKAYTFTAKGWKRAGYLQSKNVDVTQAFVAMWFSNDGAMDTTRESIKRAIKDAGYTPVTYR